MTVVRQADFGGGIWQELDSPSGYVYDAVDAVVQGADLWQRGGSSFKGTAAAGDVTVLWDGVLAAGRRTVLIAGTALQVLAADDATPTTIGTLSAVPSGPAVESGGMLAIPLANGKVALYGGSRLTASYSVGTATVGANSTGVVGIGTSWGLPNTDPGMIFVASDGTNLRYIVAESFPNGIGARLRDPSPFASAGLAYTFQPFTEVTGSDALSLIDGVTVPYKVGVAGRKLLVASRNRLYEALPNEPASFVWQAATPYFNYLTFEGEILGVSGLGNNALVFTTGGTFLVADVAVDLTDAAGNPQQSVALVSRDVVLWGDEGLSAWAAQAIVPALDDVYLFSPGSAPVPISRGIRGLYRSYVRAGYKPGQAAVFGGHYLLPVLNGSFVVDLLVCRLDQRDAAGNFRPAWTRWSGFVAGSAFAMRPATSAAGPLLLGVQGGRLLDVSNGFEPSGGVRVDADDGPPQFAVTLNDAATGPGNLNTVQRVRVQYELVGDGAELSASYVLDDPDASAGGSVLLPLAGESVGTRPASWRLAKRARRVRLRLLSSGAASTLRLRAVEFFIRPSNRP